MNRIQGSKYSGIRSVVDISKDVRKDIKEAIRLHELPSDLKVSVRSNTYAGGQSIDLTWSAGSGTHQIVCSYHRTPVEHCAGSADGHDLSAYVTVGLSTLGNIIEKKLKDIAMAYNYDNSDVRSDYFDTLFYCTPSWNWQVKPTASNLVGIDRRGAETFVTLHYVDRMPAWDALRTAQKLEVLA